MTGVKRKLLMRLKSIKTMDSLDQIGCKKMKRFKRKLLKRFKSIMVPNPEQILLVSASALNPNWCVYSPEKSNVKVRAHLMSEEEQEMIIQTFLSVYDSEPEPEPEIIDVAELMKGLEDEEINDKENIRPETTLFISTENIRYSNLSNGSIKGLGVKECPEGVCKNSPLPKTGISMSFRQQDSGSLFDPKLLAVFEEAVMEVKTHEEEISINDEQRPLKNRKLEEIGNPLLDFEEKCPPRGKDSVILYTTGLKVVPKTYEDCQNLHSLLETSQILYYERDVSIHSKYRDELWEILGEKTLPPRLFIKGRYIGGAEEIMKLYEQEKLRPLFEGVPTNLREGPCDECAGVQFVMCFNCHGSRKFVPDEDDKGEFEECTNCNENGLIPCLVCS